MMFKDLQIGDTFDFINDDPAKRMFNSFYERCTKVSARCYTWVSDVATQSTLRSRVGSTSAKVYHVNEGVK